jgi:hypothetical protein
MEDGTSEGFVRQAGNTISLENSAQMQMRQPRSALLWR